MPVMGVPLGGSRYVTKENLVRRLQELELRIARVEKWGAVLTALDEERRSLLMSLGEDK